jgi:tetratricopeptide (TPR) repeat protein
LAPGNAAYFQQRGTVHWQLRQGPEALADFDQAVKLDAQSVPARLSRAELLLQKGDRELAVSDLDAADTVAAKQADVRLMMARLYERADRLAPALREFDLWIAAHDEDARLPAALNGRCWLRALADVDLPLALKDCNVALKRAPKASEFYGRVSNSRGLVFLRLGRCDEAIADWDAAVKWIPKDAWSWYGRGICKLRKQQAAAGEADIAQAKALWPTVADEFERRGIRNPGAAPN